MNKFNNKGHLKLIVVTGILILLSTLMLKIGISFIEKKGIGKAENISIQSISEKFITNKSSKNSSNPKGDQAGLKQQSSTDPLSKPPTIEEVEKNDYLTGGKPIDIKEQDELYESVKDKVNIKKEDAAIIFKKDVYNLFNESVNISNNEIFFFDKQKVWYIPIENDKSKKYYCCVLDSITGECASICRVDYTGFKKSEHGGYYSKRKIVLKEGKLDFYINKTKEILTTNNIFNLKNSKIQEVKLKDSLYIGIRPLACMNATMDDGKSAEVDFYIDTDELEGIHIDNN
ncbi:MAG: hypothetical protein Q8900_08390 [Bacillota bacterium]|nr:hypothetical protein [Bacillota bacterium]